MNDLNVLTEPLTQEQMKAMMNENCYVTAIVPVYVSDLIDNDLEGVLDLLSELMTGSLCLMNIGYKVVGVIDEYTLAIQVEGDVSEVINDYDEE